MHWGLGFVPPFVLPCMCVVGGRGRIEMTPYLTTLPAPPHQPHHGSKCLWITFAVNQPVSTTDILCSPLLNLLCFQLNPTPLFCTTTSRLVLTHSLPLHGSHSLLNPRIHRILDSISKYQSWTHTEQFHAYIDTTPLWKYSRYSTLPYVANRYAYIYIFTFIYCLQHNIHVKQIGCYKHTAVKNSAKPKGS